MPLKKQNSLALGLLSLLLVSLACAMPGWGAETPSVETSIPQVVINTPADQPVIPGQEIRIQSTSTDKDQGVVRVELLVNNEVVWVDANPNPQPNTPYLVAQPWTPETPGSYIILVKAYNTDNVAGQSAPWPVDAAVSAQTAVSGQTVEEAASPEAASTSTATPTIAALADVDSTSTPSMPATAVTATSLPVCTPPPCRLDDNEVYYCADECPGGCGTICATVTPLPTATPTPGIFAPTGLEPEGRFKDIWQAVGGGKSRLGYPTGPEIVDRNYARQYFERGLMFWWDQPDDGPDYIWVIDSPAADLKSGTAWNRYDDTWADEDEFSCDAARANGNFGPIRGFGQVWCEHPALQTRLGNPRDYEGGSGGSPPFAHVQFFQGGVIIYNPLNVEVFVLFDQGDWLRFLY